MDGESTFLSPPPPLSLSSDQIRPNPIARLVVVIIILTTPQTKYIHAYIQLIQTTDSPTMEKEKFSPQISHP